jgi:transcriptional regulator with XRE-family HTH domain
MAKDRRYQRLRRALVQLRRDARLTQSELAARLQKPQSFVSKYERGDRRLDVIDFAEVVRALGADPGAVLECIRQADAAKAVQ